MDIAWLVLGVVLAAVGGDRFVQGAIGLSSALRVSPGVIGATVAAFATSSPELSVAVNGALEGDATIALGEALGSNVMNVGLVLGTALVMAPIVERSRDIRRDLPVALAAAGLLGLIAADGTISRLDAGLLLALFAGWSGRVVADARHDRSSPQAERLRPTLVSLTVGLVLLVAAGRLVVMGAQGLGDLLGWDEFLVGATFVAIGTSTPEFVTAVVAARRGHGDIGVGLIIGSNVFNTLFIVGVAAGLQPVEVVWSETALVLGAGLVMTLAAVPGRDGRLGRGRGVLLLVLLVVYLAVLVRGVPS